MSEMELFTVGHSNHSMDRFLELLKQHGIEAIVDIRRFPASKKFPHFNRSRLADALLEDGVDYHWLESLGGRRRETNADSPSVNSALRNQGFRNYADYMLTDEFRQGVNKLLGIAGEKRTAAMCAEGLFWQCHRRLLSDYLLANGLIVQHILPTSHLEPHKLTLGVRIEDGKVTYPESHPLFDGDG